ncbi:CpsB/CapC family capsule biosynthesis tyrosine phosphatase [Virgibacillus ihumii]|uniref:CpsB/CapC family capsule biosynthesis tyrosine phosphatase n=1 Tax=Virgibacillus ihumii TaxID=2686091 RepID=UPI00157DB71A|nr:CpsB/CapC family capsule biosynthesis tyrosine phosphatase [Virgibacillus ihumii]
MSEANVVQGQDTLHESAGQGIQIYEDIVHDLKRGHIIPLKKNAGYVLIELPSNHLPPYISTVIYDMQMAGYTPIFSNVERNKDIMDKPNNLYRMVKRGALVQVSAAGVIGKNGRKAEKLIQLLLGVNMIHFIVSDVQDSRKGEFQLQKAYKRLGNYYEKYFRENSNLLFSGE